MKQQSKKHDRSRATGYLMHNPINGWSAALIPHPVLKGAWLKCDQAVLLAACPWPGCMVPIGTPCKGPRKGYTTSVHGVRRSAAFRKDPPPWVSQTTGIMVRVQDRVENLRRKVIRRKFAKRVEAMEIEGGSAEQDYGNTDLY